MHEYNKLAALPDKEGKCWSWQHCGAVVSNLYSYLKNTIRIFFEKFAFSSYSAHNIVNVKMMEFEL